MRFLETLENEQTEWKLVPVSTLTLGFPVVTDISQAVRRDYTLSLPTGEVYLVPDGYAGSIFQRAALYIIISTVSTLDIKTHILMIETTERRFLYGS